MVVNVRAIECACEVLASIQCATAKIIRGSVVTAATAAALLVLSSATHAAGMHRCAGAATEQAKSLLAFHAGPDKRIEIDASVKQRSPLPNPARKRQLFDVLEVWGHIYKGQYRMRFIYARLPGECVLMGQEILEHATL
jgi:hypothetical protein